MDNKVKEIRRARWRTVIMAQKESGLSITEWCKNNGLRARQFHYWQRVLRDEGLLKTGSDDAAPVSDPAAPRPGTGLPADAAQTFAELPVPLPTVQTGLQDSGEQLFGSSGRDSGIRITCRDIDIRIADDFNEGTLAKVLQVIRNA